MGARGVLDRLGSVIPGYRGYMERELRRSTDRVIRDVVVSRLGSVRQRVVRLIADHARAMRLDGLESLERARRRLDLVMDQVRHAPEGYSGFFDAVQITAADLDTIHAHDAALCDGVEALAASLGALEAGDASAFDPALEAFEEAVRVRRERLRGVKSDA